MRAKSHEPGVSTLGESNICSKKKKRLGCIDCAEIKWLNWGKKAKFFAQSDFIKYTLPQAAQLSIFYHWKIGSVAPPWGTWLRKHYREIERKKAQHPAGFKPTTSWVFALESCAQPLCYNRCQKPLLSWFSPNVLVLPISGLMQLLSLRWLGCRIQSSQ